MTATEILQRDATPRSRRALLAGVLGGLGAWVASAAARVEPAAAAAGDPVRIGRVNEAGRSKTELNGHLSYPEATLKVRQFGDGQAINAVGKNPIVARVPEDEPFGIAVMANSGNVGISAFGKQVGVAAGGIVAVEGRASSIGKGVTGVLGVSHKGKGVSGQTERGKAIHGRAHQEGWAGYFEGRLFSSRYIELGEVAGPQAPESAHARLFVRDSGGGKLQLCVRFPTGAVQVIATQP